MPTCHCTVDIVLRRRGVIGARLSLIPACWFAIACTALAGLDEDYELARDGGTSVGGNGAVSGASGNGGSSGSGGQAASGSGGQAADGGTVGTGGSGGSSGPGGTGGAPGGEDCANAVDDDGDQRIDCFDAECGAAAECAGKCSDAATLSCNSVLTQQSTGAAGSTERLAPPNYACAPGLRPGPEYAYRVSGTPGDEVFVSIYGLEADLGLFVVEVADGAQCDAAQGCRAFSDGFTSSDPEGFGFSLVSGRDYFLIVDGWTVASYSIAVQCSVASTCRPVQAIQAGQVITASNAAGSAPNVTNNQTDYDCAAGNETAPEAAFMFTPTETGNYEVSLSNFGANLDVFIVPGPDCNTHCLNAGVNAASADERFTFAAQANTSYYIVIDGYGVSSFTLTVNKV